MAKRTSPYEKELDTLLDLLQKELEEGKSKPKLLLHACCGPCSSYVIEYLTHFFDITIYYYNPNIYPQEEYERRLKELEDFLPRFPAAASVRLVKDYYEPKDFYDAINIENEPDLKTEAEKGERCRRCYLFRMKKAYNYATSNDFDYFTTTLSISPFKDAGKINTIGRELEKQGKTSFLPSDFKKKGGFLRSLELSQEYNLYRQDYCGCVFSKINTEAARASRSESQ